MTKPKDETHSACNTALKLYGGKTICCYCSLLKHDCDFMIKQTPNLEELIEEIDALLSNVEFLHGVPVSMQTKDKEKIKTFIKKVYEAGGEAEKITGDTSDGYHTFNELYEFRVLYNSALFNEWANGHKEGFAPKYDVHKSKKHNDGSKCFDGKYFVVMAETPWGQISNHYELKDWDLFNIPTKSKANKWDGHTSKNVVDTLKKMSGQKISYKQMTSKHDQRKI